MALNKTDLENLSINELKQIDPVTLDEAILVNEVRIAKIYDGIIHDLNKSGNTDGAILLINNRHLIIGD